MTNVVSKPGGPPFHLQFAAPDIVMMARMNGEEVSIEGRAGKADETSAIESELKREELAKLHERNM